MIAQKFDNLYDFFDYIEFCPLCKSRTTVYAAFPAATVCEINGKELILFDSETASKKFSINLINNIVSDSYSSSYRKSNSEIVIGKQCNKYHFFYNGIAKISKSNLIVNDISLDKYHFIRQHGSTHFTVNGSLLKDQTNIRITTTNFKTRELSLPFINFDLFNKKKIDSKLKNIQLLA